MNSPRPQRACAFLVAWMLVFASSGCGGHTPSERTTPSRTRPWTLDDDARALQPPPDTAASETTGEPATQIQSTND